MWNGLGLELRSFSCSSVGWLAALVKFQGSSGKWVGVRRRTHIAQPYESIYLAVYLSINA